METAVVARKDEAKPDGPTPKWLQEAVLKKKTDWKRHINKSNNSWRVIVKHINDAEMESVVVDGYPVQIVDEMRDELNTTIQKAREIVGLKPATLSRRKKTGRLNSDESDRIYRVMRVMAVALSLFGSTRAVAEWINSPAYGLSERCPIDLLGTGPGCDKVIRLIERIKDGSF